MIDEKLLRTSQKLHLAVLNSHKQVDESLPQKVAKIVQFHARCAAAAAIASGVLPGLGTTLAVTISFGFIWTMYGKINKEIQVPLSRNVLQSLASSIATHLVTYALAGVILSTFSTLLPIIGAPTAMIFTGSICYALTFASGYIYIKMWTKIFLSGENPSNYEVNDLQILAARVIDTREIKYIIKEAKKSYRRTR